VPPWLEIVVHAVIRGDHHLIPLCQPLGQQVGQQAVHAARLIAVLAGIEAELVARIVHPHGVDQQKIGVVLAAQPLAVHQQMAVGVAVIPVEAAVLDGQLLIVSEAIAGRQPGALVVELAHPVVGRRCGAFARGPGQMEDGVMPAQARHPVVGDAARHRRHAGQDALVERAGEEGRGTQGRMQAAPASTMPQR
jgi:hypothetical protein